MSEAVTVNINTCSEPGSQCQTAQLLQRIYRLLQQHGARLQIHYSTDLKGNNMQLTDVQQVTASIAETDVVGNPVAVDPATVTWAVSDPTILDLAQQPDGSAVLKAKGPLGACQVSVQAGALSAQDSITVVASAATALAIKFGEPA